ncbi:hypothetical protein DIPPA_04969 [Diplonema papillatum]|nr:hypothetical protein DIPPA_04969 [Diplonema papillatum]
MADQLEMNAAGSPQTSNYSDRADGPLVARKLDMVGLAANSKLVDHLEMQGDRVLYYSAAVTEVGQGGIAVKRVIALTESGLYKLPATAVETGIFGNTRLAVQSLRAATIIGPADCPGLTVRLEWAEKPAPFSIAFKDVQQRRDFLLTVCHLVPAIAVTSNRSASPARGDAMHSASPDSEQSPPGFARHELRPLPQKPVLTDNQPESTAARPELTGDMTLEDMKSMVQLLCCSHLSPPRADKLTNGRGPPDPEDELGSFPADSSPHRPLSASPEPRHETEQQKQYSPFSPSRAHRVGTLPKQPFVYPPMCREFSIRSARSSSEGHALAVPVTYYLSIDDKVEVRDSPNDPWQHGVVRSFKGDTTLVPFEGGLHYYVLASDSSDLTVQPEGSDRAFSWKDIRVCTEYELAKRERESAITLRSQLRAEAVDEERRRIRQQLLSMELRLEQGLREKTMQQREAAARIAMRQRGDDPRVLAIRGLSNQRASPSFHDSQPSASPENRDAASPEHRRFHNCAWEKERSGAPDDRTLLGEDLFKKFREWKKTGGLTDGGAWSMDDSKTLLSGLKTARRRLESMGRHRASLDRLDRIAGYIERERSMVQSRDRSEPLRSAEDRKLTVPKPFKLSQPRKPPVFLSSDDFNRELRLAALKSQKELDNIRKSHSVNRSSTSPKHTS